ncbi:MAG: ribokinase [Planctomycetaceae bacterium]|mgnify:CR=1 FL=1|nr:ribokinase [Planctomycetaceae bacterium]
MSGKIVVIGSSNVDLIMKMSRLPQRGETITDAVFVQTFGGKGANQAVAAARAGGRVAFVNCVGDDRYGAAIRANLQEAGVDVQYVFTAPGQSSGTALVMIGEGGDNYLAVAPGANYCLARTHIEQVQPLLDQAALVMLQCEIVPECLEYVIARAAERHRPIMLNLAPARTLPAHCLQALTYLIVNESEAEFLCGFAVDSLARARDAALALRTQGPRVVVITLGAQGAYVAADQSAVTHVPAFAVQPVDATAAGDTFCGALAAALVEGQPLARATTFANAAAAISVTRLGAQPSIPARPDIEQFLRHVASSC